MSALCSFSKLSGLFYLCISARTHARVLLGFQIAVGTHYHLSIHCMETAKITEMCLQFMRMESSGLVWVLNSFVFSWPTVLGDINCYCIQDNQAPHFILSLFFHHWYSFVCIHWRALILLRNHRSPTVSMCWVLLLVSCLTNVDFINSACGYWCLREK